MADVLVYVINQNGHPLMPCQPAKARKLLRDKRAKVMRRTPFTIKLLWDCEEHVQDVTVGIDKGSAITGFSCVGKGQVLLSGDIHHRRDVKEKMDARRAHRRSRRSRMWYRPPRWRHRASSKRSGRLPPSLRTNVEEVIRVMQHIPLPIARIIIEDVQVDIACLDGPTLRGSRYQDPTRLDENLRIACLMRVKGRSVKQINSIYSNGYLAFPRVKGEPTAARPKDCQLLERGRTILWEQQAGQNQPRSSRICYDS